MRVQLDALHLCRILALRHTAFFDGVNEKNVVADEFIVFDLALDADGAALADRLQDALDLCVDVLLRRLAAHAEEFLARDAVRLVGEFQQEDVRTRFELIRLRREDLALEDDAFHLVLDHAKRACLARYAASDDDAGGQLLRLCSLCRTRGGGCGGFLFHGHRHGRRCPICTQLTDLARHADNLTRTADVHADGALDALCNSALREQLRAEHTRRREADDVAVDGVLRLAQRVKEDGILPRSLAHDALPERCNGRRKRNDVLLHECTREAVVLLDLPRHRGDQFLIEDGGRADDKLPRIFLCRYLDVTQRARTQKRPLLVGEGEPAQQAEEHILRTG